MQTQKQEYGSVILNYNEFIQIILNMSVLIKYFLK